MVILTILANIYVRVKIAYSYGMLPGILSVDCHHTSHLFKNPLCKSQSLIKRIANIVFHILTLGIPFLFYHVVSYFNTLIAPSSIEPFKLKKVLLSQTGVNAIKDVQTMLNGLIEQDSTIGMGWLEHIVYPPINPEFCQLVDTYWDVVFNNFVKALKENQENPWYRDQVLKAADQLMKLSYSISISILQDLPDYIRDLKLQGYPEGQDIYNRVLSDVNCYPSFMLHYCSQVYGWLQAEVVWDEKSQSLKVPERFTINQHDEDNLISIYSNLKFYDRSGLTAQWRCLYNDYCKNTKRILGKVTKNIFVPKQDIDMGDPVFLLKSTFKGDLGKDQKRLVAPYGRLKVVLDKISKKDVSDEEHFWLKNFSVEGKNALDFSQSEIDRGVNIVQREHPGYIASSKTRKFYKKNKIDLEITRLYQVVRRQYTTRFIALINKFSTQAWIKDDVLEQADQILKNAYTASILMLDDLLNFCELYHFDTCDEALLDMDSCLSEILFLFPNLYISFRKNLIKGSGLFFFHDLTFQDSATHRELFFLEDKIHQTWRCLYNDYCHRVRTCIINSKLSTSANTFLDLLVLDSDKSICLEMLEFHGASK